MAGDKWNKERQNRLPPFVPVLVGTMDSPAWIAMSHGAKILYISLKRRYNLRDHNNGRIFLSQRAAAKEIGSHHNQIARWLRELQHYGFIVMTDPGRLGVQGRGRAPRWRLTELGYMKDPPTQNFLRWNGVKFRPPKSRTRAGKPARSAQQNHHTDVPEKHSPLGESVLE
jgi:hypothetical protein